jgi:hypothetical protein
MDGGIQQNPPFQDDGPGEEPWFLDSLDLNEIRRVILVTS